MTNRTFKVVTYPSEFNDVAKYTAHCLELDLIADGETIESALNNLKETIKIQLEAMKQYNSNLILPAPKKYWDMFDINENSFMRFSFIVDV